MFTVLSQLQPALVGQPIARYVKQNIFDPLNMTASTYSYALANSKGQRADGMGRQGINLFSTDPFAGQHRAVQYWSPTTSGEDGDGKSSNRDIVKNDPISTIK